MTTPNPAQVATQTAEDRVSEERVARLLRATRANDMETAPAQHSQQTDQCPSIGRFAAVYQVHGRWSAKETEHIRTGCPFCQKVLGMFRAVASEVSHEDTVTGLNTADETKLGFPSKPIVPPGDKPKPPGDKPKPS